MYIMCLYGLILGVCGLLDTFWGKQCLDPFAHDYHVNCIIIPIMEIVGMAEVLTVVSVLFFFDIIISRHNIILKHGSRHSTILEILFHL